jgi:iron complex transport system permease protein
LPNTKRNTFLFLALFIGLILLFFINLSFGSVTIPFKEVFNSLTGEEVSKQTWEYIVVHYRLPKAITAVLTGVGLSTSGLLMQTLFRNPLAGPDVLGLSSGSSLAVAFVILGAGFMPFFLSEYFLSPYIIMIASCLGSLSVLLTILLVSQRLRDTMSILIMGMMFSSFTVAIISILIYFSSAEQLQKFTFWSMGNLGNLSWLQIIVLTTTI